MSTDLTNTQRPRETRDTCADIGWEERLRPLLQEMLAGVRRHRETTLLADFDGHAIVAAALRSLSPAVPRTALSNLRQMDAVTAVFNQLVKRALQDQRDYRNDRMCLPSAEQSDGTSATAGQQHYEKVARWLAVWLEQFCMVINEVHPKAIGIVILRVEGCDNRQVARRLGLTMRLVTRIAGDIHPACKSMME